MSDYCECGQLATARCACGTTICSIHTKHPQPYHSSALTIAALSRKGHPDGDLFTALANAWANSPNIMCGSCYGRTIDEVAHAYARVFEQHTDGRAETIASVLLVNESWTTGREYHATETIGQKTLRSAGHHVQWSHPDPLDTASRLYASLHGEPGLINVRMRHFRTRQSLFAGTKVVESFTHLGSIRAWTESASYTDDGYTERLVVFIGLDGTHHHVSAHGDDLDGVYFNNEQDAAAARDILESPFRPSPTARLFLSKEKAIAVALTKNL